jgi:hypothetical protein
VKNESEKGKNRLDWVAPSAPGCYDFGICFCVRVVLRLCSCAGELEKRLVRCAGPTPAAEGLRQRQRRPQADLPQVLGPVGEGALPGRGGRPRQRRRRRDQTQEVVGEGVAFGAAHLQLQSARDSR